MKKGGGSSLAKPEALPSRTRIPRYVGQQNRNQQQKKTSKGPILSEKDSERVRVYALKWKQKVFGCLTFADARIHYRKKLLLSVVRRWHYTWWEERREWRLLVRADIHRRFSVFQQIWRGWSVFMKKSQAKGRKLEKATRYGNRSLLWKTYMALRLYSARRKEEREVSQQAYSWSDKRVTLSAFNLWKTQKVRLDAMKDDHKKAISFRTETIQQQAYKAWKGQFLSALDMKRRTLAAVCLSNRICFRQMWTYWIQYIAECRDQKQAKGTALLFAQTSLLRNYYDVWFSKCRIKQLLSGFLGRLVIEYRRAKARQCFMRWKIYVYFSKRKIEKTAMAMSHWRRKITVSALHAFVLYWRARKKKMEIYSEAQRVYFINLLRRHWLTWCYAFELTEDKRQIEESEQAKSRYSSILLRKMMAKWKGEKLIVDNAKILKDKAEVFCISCIQKRHFMKWQSSVPLYRRRESLVMRATLHYNNVLTTWAYFTWIAAYSDIQCLKNMNDTAVQQRARGLLRRSYLSWKSLATARSTAIQLWVQASIHHSSFLFRQIVRRWFCFASGQRKKRQLHALAGSHSAFKVGKKTLDRWLECLELKRTLHKKHATCAMYISMRAKVKCFESWKLFRERRIRKGHKLTLARQTYRTIIARQCFFAWRSYVKRHLIEKQLAAQAKSFCFLKLQTLMMRKWTSRYQWTQNRTMEKENELQHAQPYLAKVFLRSYFRYWSDARRCVQASRKADARACRKLNLQAFVAWKCFARMQVYQRLQSGQAMRFRCNYLLLTAVSFWTKKHEAAKVQRDKKRLGLIFWSQKLAHQCFAAWLAYTLDVQRFKSRVQRALQTRRENLLQQGVQAWVKYSWSASSSRTDRLARLKSMDSTRQLQRADAVGKKWRRWAREKAAQRESSSTQKPKQLLRLPKGSHLVSTVPGRTADSSPSDREFRDFPGHFERIQPRKGLHSRDFKTGKRESTRKPAEGMLTSKESYYCVPSVEEKDASQHRRKLKLQIIAKMNQRLDDLARALQNQRGPVEFHESCTDN